jgi:Protein of unknown function (DUF2934)
MTAKRASPRKTTPKAKAKSSTPVPALTERAVLTILESEGHTAADPPPVAAELRRQMVAAAAYFLAERRGFAAGHDLEDWLAAEAMVDSRLRETRAA